MIYSRWRPDKGGYDYFESPERYGLGDDLPVPSLSSSSPIGVSSIAVGRMPPAGIGLTPAGSGALARGMVMPTDRSGLQGLGALSGVSMWTIAAVSALAGALAYHFVKEKK